uniref:VPS10 domain-containing protein n=1 Tax=Timema bartmani TaxID=61472 RepID=A0A7R9EZK8_9NEOP|nr:unnamed protein product [Timema bartmani]
MEQINFLNDSHQQLMVHWVGEGSDVIVCLARNINTKLNQRPSAVYISNNYGDTFENITNQFELGPNKGYATLDKFYTHPKYNLYMVFADVTNQMIYTSTSPGTVTRIKLNFHPSNITFHEEEPLTFLAYDMVDPEKKLWLTKDFGQTWYKVHEYVKAFYWVTGPDSSDPAAGQTTYLALERGEPKGSSTVLLSKSLFQNPRDTSVLIEDVDNFQVRGDFMFVTRKSGRDNLDLYISHKKGEFLRAQFQSEMNRREFYIADITDTQVFVAVSHTQSQANLYVSQAEEGRSLKFALSLERIFCYFPNTTWRDSWLRYMIHYSRQYVEELWVSIGTGKHQHIVAAHEISSTLSPENSTALPVSFTGCDSVSQFSRKGKKTAWETFPKATTAFLAMEVVLRVSHSSLMSSDRMKPMSGDWAVYEKPFSKKSNVADETFADFHKVEGLDGIYIASQVFSNVSEGKIGPEHLMTMITFDRGGVWQPLAAPLYDEDGNRVNCSIIGRGYNEDTMRVCFRRKAAHCTYHRSSPKLYPLSRSVPILSSRSAPGVIMATGVLGKSLKGHPGVFLSTDAGLSWRQILNDYYFFNFGDHGGVLVAVKYYKAHGETRELLYSTDDGETWQTYEFSKNNLRVYGLMTEPGENTTIFTMFGSFIGAHQWLILKVDLRNAFTYVCTKDDYKFWSPSAVSGPRMPCLMGRKETYERRVPHSNCYNGRDYDRPVKLEVCECELEDFEW